MAEIIIIPGALAIIVGLLISWSGTLGDHKTKKKEGDRE